MLIELRNVSKSFGTVHALKGLNAGIEGDVIGLLGPNGAGKSTLLKCMLGLLEHDGEARVLGLSSAAESFRIRDRVGYMPEMDSYLPGMTAVELCTYAGELSGLPRNEAMQRAHAALFYAGLEDKRYQKVDGYSTGLKQRAKLAQALVHDPDLLFLDEPTNGLDPRSRDEMLELIVQLPKKRGCSIIISTHLLFDVERICDQVVIMHMGQMRFSGSIHELRQDKNLAGVPGIDTKTAGHPYRGEDAETTSREDRTYNVEVKENLDALAERLEAAGCAVTKLPPIVLTAVLPGRENANLILREAKAADVQVRRLQIDKESLESAFLRVVEGADNADAAANAAPANQEAGQ